MQTFPTEAVERGRAHQVIAALQYFARVRMRSINIIRKSVGYRNMAILLLFIGKFSDDSGCSTSDMKGARVRTEHLPQENLLTTQHSHLPTIHHEVLGKGQPANHTIESDAFRATKANAELQNAQAMAHRESLLGKRPRSHSDIFDYHGSDSEDRPPKDKPNRVRTMFVYDETILMLHNRTCG